MTIAERVSRAVPRGNPTPRIAPPVPARSEWREFHALASRIGISLYPWQDTACRYLTAMGPGDRLLYPETAIIVGRQAGKTMLLKPLIVRALRNGLHVMHTAQNAKLPREIHEDVAAIMEKHFPKELPSRRAISYAVGHEEIRLVNGGTYRIVAPTRGGARGPANDLVIIDELREMDSDDFIGAAEPTLSASSDPQMVYLSNAGTEDSVVLNALKRRADSDPSLAYLEWSASPERPADDEDGWLEANPDIGHNPGKLTYLRRKYESYRLAGTLAIFETEHLCRWVVTIRKRLLDDYAWGLCGPLPLGDPRRPVMAVSMDPAGRRASAALAWLGDEVDGVATVHLRLMFDVTGSPIDTDALGKDMRDAAIKVGARQTGYDPVTDGELAKYLKRPVKVGGRDFANATATFTNAVNGRRLRWDQVAQVTDDLTWTARKPHDETGAYEAVRANDDRPITAVLAAIRAVWLASGPKPPTPKVM